MKNEYSERYEDLHERDEIRLSLFRSRRQTNEPKRRNPHIIDDMIENLHFTKFHLACVMVCIFSMLCDGYLTLHIKYCINIFPSKFNWLKHEVSALFIIQNILYAIGALASVTCKSQHWDVSSNMLVGILGLVCIVMISFYADAMTYAALICLYSVCHGFINNICTKYLLELLKMRIRGYFFLLVSSFRLLGMAIYGLVIWYFEGSYNITDPNVHLIGLGIIQVFLCISLAYVLDSPRIMFYNGELVQLYIYIQEITTADEDFVFNINFKQEMVSKLVNSKEEIELRYGYQGDEGLLKNYTYLFKKPIRKLMMKALMMMFLSIYFISNISDSYYYFKVYKQPITEDAIKSDYIFGMTNYAIFIFYLIQFLIVNMLAIGYYFFTNLKRYHFAIIAVSAGLLMLVLIAAIRSSFTVLIGMFNAFAYFYFIICYLYFSECITTKVRNNLTSLMATTICITKIFIYYMIPLLGRFNPYLNLAINFFVAGIMILFEIFLMTFETKDKKLQEIELIILNSKPVKS